METIKLDINRIRKFCTESSFERGERYFEEGRVEITDATPSSVVATVKGTENYRVEMQIDDTIRASCSCPYDWGGYCKHIVATYLALIQDEDVIEEILEVHEAEEARIGTLLNGVTSKELRAFLCQELERSSELRSRFLATLSKSGKGKRLNDYKKEIGRLYIEASSRDGYVDYWTEIDFSSFEELAELYRSKEYFLEAARIYRALSEAIAENMDYVDDSNGYYDDNFTRFIDTFVECMLDAKQDFDQKKEYIKYLFEKYTEGEPDYCEDNYYDGLKNLCITEEDLKYWQELLEPYVQEELPGILVDVGWSKRHRVGSYISMQLHILSKLGENESFYELMERCYNFNENFCLMYAEQLKKDGEIERAIGIAEDGLEIFSNLSTRALRKFLSDLYRKSDTKKYKENLLFMFHQDRSWKHYETLKSISSDEEWKSLFGDMLDHFSQGPFGRDMRIKMFLREKMYDEALREVLEANSLSTLKQYQRELAGLSPAEYFQIYKKLIVPFIDGKTGRSHYREAISYLKMMREIEGFGAEFEELIRALKAKYPRRPAFIEEMNIL